MEKYPIKILNKDFKILDYNYSLNGSRIKYLVIDNNKNKAFFKYEGTNYIVSESCSEKMCYEIAKVLGYPCAKIELARDSDGTLGILNYLFVDMNFIQHIDILSYLNKNEKERNNFYTISNIKKVLDNLNVNLFADFVKIMIFDALVGEQDRHEENWGIIIVNNHYYISPLYDNGCSLLREFKNDNLANQYYSNKKSFEAYIRKSKTYFYKEDKKTRYGHFELIHYLYLMYPDIVVNEIIRLKKLTDKKIEEIVEMIPDDLLTKIHKKYIIMYLKRRKEILLKIIE